MGNCLESTVQQTDLKQNIKSGFILEQAFKAKVCLNQVEVGAIINIKFSPDEKYFAVSTSNKIIQLWDSENNQIVDQFIDKHHDFIYSIDFSHDSKFLLVSCEDKTIGIYKKQELSKGYQFMRNIKLDEVYLCIRFEPTSYDILMGGWSKSLDIWNFQDEKDDYQLKKKHSYPMSGVVPYIKSIEFCHNYGQKGILATGDTAFILTIWKKNEQQQDFSVQHKLTKQEGNILCIKFTTDDLKIVFSTQTLIKLFCLDKKTVLQTFDDHQNEVSSFIVLENFIYSTGWNQKIIKREFLQDLTKEEVTHNAMGNCLALNKKKQVFIGYQSGEIFILQV